MFKLSVISVLLVFTSQAFAVCDSGYTIIPAVSFTITEGVISKVLSLPTTFSAGTCNLNVTAYFSTLKESGTDQTCKAVPVSSFTNAQMANSVTDCILVQSTVLKQLVTSQMLSKKLSASGGSASMNYNGSGGFTIE